MSRWSGVRPNESTSIVRPPSVRWKEAGQQYTSRMFACLSTHVMVAFLSMSHVSNTFAIYREGGLTR
jgi:hypothetical protein